MIFENTEVFNFRGAFRGMRNPLESWDKSDSNFESGNIYIGPNDLKLAQTLIRSGGSHRKFLRQIIVCFDLTAPLYFWKEFDTYKVGTVANSTSTMHKLATTPITIECFEIDDYEPNLKYEDNSDYQTFTVGYDVEEHINFLENLRLKFLETKDKRYWKELIRWLPESWLQTRTLTMSYENIMAMIQQRKNHKLAEWSESMINYFKTLPYADELLFLEKKE